MEKVKVGILSVALLAAASGACGKYESPSQGTEPLDGDGVEYIDLSREEPANCYIVSAPGDYKFNAMVKGNGDEALDGIPESVEILWETFSIEDGENAKDLVEFLKLEGGYVCFTAEARKGNAIIGVRDGEKKILWSWHIWFTEYPKIQSYRFNAGSLMDRNLGAISTVGHEALGFLYQWGRKDPFRNSPDIPWRNYGAYPLSHSGPEEIDFAITHPAKFIGASQKPYDWLTPQNGRLWGSVKTIYDPCPPGYRVPDGGDDGVWKAAGFDTAPRKFSDGIFYFGVRGDGSPVRYDAAGFGGEIYEIPYKRGLEGHYWSCTEKDSLSYCLEFNATDVNPAGTDNRVLANSVRCFKEH